MGILNLASDGLPSVLFALVRALRRFGPMEKEELLGVCCPQTLQAHTSGFERDRLGQKTLLRWTQLGLFTEDCGKVSLHGAVEAIPTGRFAEVRALGALLRRLALSPDNNRELNVEGGVLGADLSLALSWVLAQDIFSLPGGAYKYVEEWETTQFAGSAPYAFRNDTRWNGFRAWAPLLGFGWTEGNSVLVVDPTTAVGDELPAAFGRAPEMPVDEFVRRLADALPVLDEGEYRQQVEGRLSPISWRPTRRHELSISLSTALKRLDTKSTIRLESRADAPKRTLLGRGFRELGQVSHVVRGEPANA